LSSDALSPDGQAELIPQGDMDMASNILRFPCGGGCRPWIIATVTIEDTGVAAYDNTGRIVGWVPCVALEVKQRVSDALMNCLDAGKRFEQPDWARLLRDE